MNRIQRRATARKTDVGAICAAAAALASRGRSAEAIAGYRLALTIAPTLAKAHCDLANLLCKHGRIEEAICHMKRAIACAPELAEPDSNLGNILNGMMNGTGRLVPHAIAHNAAADARNDPGAMPVALDH